jgi:hypothetical protein
VHGGDEERGERPLRVRREEINACIDGCEIDAAQGTRVAARNVRENGDGELSNVRVDNGVEVTDENCDEGGLCGDNSDGVGGCFEQRSDAAGGEEDDIGRLPGLQSRCDRRAK